MIVCDRFRSRSPTGAHDQQGGSDEERSTTGRPRVRSGSVSAARSRAAFAGAVAPSTPTPRPALADAARRARSCAPAERPARPGRRATARSGAGRAAPTPPTAAAHPDAGRRPTSARPGPLPLRATAARVHSRRRPRRVGAGRVRAAAPAQPRGDRRAPLTDRATPGIAEVLDGVLAAVRAELVVLARPRRRLPRARRRCCATVTEPFLDLGAGEVVGAARLARSPRSATQLDAPLPRRCARASGARRACACSTRSSRRRDWHWLGLDGDVHNWNPWIHGNVLVAALRLDGRRRRRAAAGRSRSRSRASTATSPCSPPTARSTRATRTGGTAPAARSRRSTSCAHATGRPPRRRRGVPALRETVAFPHRMHLGGRLVPEPRRRPGPAARRAAVARPAPRGAARRRHGCRGPRRRAPRRRRAGRRPRPRASAGCCAA